MSKARDLIQELPKIAKVMDWKRFSKSRLNDFDDEVNNKNSVFAWIKSDADYPRKRLSVLEIPRELIGDTAAYDFGMDLLALNALSHRAQKNGLTNKEINQKYDLEKALRASSGRTKEITEIENIMSIDEALKSWWW